MKETSQNFSGLYSASGSDAEETLRLIASLPAPEGLERRVHAGLRSAPRRARILLWPANGLMQTGIAGNWMRGAAAAAIVLVVAGGGWGIYTRVQSAQPARELAMPAQVGPSAGFSNAGAMRTPETLTTPVQLHPVKPETAAAKKGVRAAKPAASQRHSAKK
jgi:hypothetical protein